MKEGKTSRRRITYESSVSLFKFTITRKQRLMKRTERDRERNENVIFFFLKRDQQ